MCKVIVKNVHNRQANVTHFYRQSYLCTQAYDHIRFILVHRYKHTKHTKTANNKVLVYI